MNVLSLPMFDPLRVKVEHSMSAAHRPASPAERLGQIIQAGVRPVEDEGRVTYHPAMPHPIRTVRRVCKETGVSAEDLLAALLHPHTVAHQQIRGSSLESSAAQKFTMVDHVKDQLRRLGYSPDEPGTILQLLSLFTIEHHGRVSDPGFRAAADEQVAAARLLRDLMNEAEEEGWQDQQTLKQMDEEGLSMKFRDPGKFADFDRMISDCKRQGIHEVVIVLPQVIGDTYAELVTNLNKLADADLKLVIVPQKERGK